MKEDSNGYHVEEESLSFKTKDYHHFNGQAKDAKPLNFRAIEGNDFCNAPELECTKGVNDCIEDNETEIRVSPTKENRSGFLYHSSGFKRDEDPLASDRKDRDKLRNTLELECSIIMNDFSKYNKTRASDSPFITSSEFQRDAHLYTDENVMESELPDSVISDKEINHHVVKDICVDEGIRVDDEGLTVSRIKSNAPNEIEKDVPKEEFIVTKMLPLQDFGTRSFLRSFMASLNNDKDEVPQQSNQIPPTQANLESFTAVSEAKEPRNGPEGDLFCDSNVKNGTVAFDFNSPEPAVADNTGPSMESIEQSLKSDYVLNHNDDENTNTTHDSVDGSSVNNHQDSVLNHKNSNNPFIFGEVRSTSMDESTEKTHQETLVNYKKGNSNNPFTVSEVENVSTDHSNGDIHQSRFNPFAFSEVENANMDGDMESIHRSPMLNPQNGKSKNPFDVCEVQNPSMDVTSESIHQRPELNNEIRLTTNPFIVGEVKFSSMDGETENIHQLPELNHNNRNSSNPFAISEVHENLAEKTEDMHNQSFEPRNESNHDGTSKIIPINDHGQCADGESSFSAAGPVSGRITYTGAITYSGSTSVRSDGSTTSTRSFAFPVLQAEWNSSPVRMQKAEGRHFRKHKGWKQGILCCKF